MTNMALLQRTAAYLYEQERMSGEDFERVVAGELAPRDAQGLAGGFVQPARVGRDPEQLLAGGGGRRGQARGGRGSAAGRDEPVTARNRRRPGMRNRLRRALPRPVHVALVRLAALADEETGESSGA
ncbi:MAG: hypothetical protein U0838_06725 [Chloroflexota bacterium]